MDNTRVLNSPVFPITDKHGQPFSTHDTEPEPGSVVLTNGEYGTAWQRYFSDGLWHRVGGGRGRTWQEVLRQRKVVLVYDAPVRPCSVCLAVDCEGGCL